MKKKNRKAEKKRKNEEVDKTEKEESREKTVSLRKCIYEPERSWATPKKVPALAWMGADAERYRAFGGWGGRRRAAECKDVS